MRIVVDTNVIVSALVFGGLPRRIFELVEGGYCELFYAAEIQEETRRVLRDKFGWDEDRLDRYLRTLWSLGKRVVLRHLFSLVLSMTAQVSGSGTTNFIPKWTGSTSLGDSPKIHKLWPASNARRRLRPL